MARPADKLAQALQALRAQQQRGAVAIRSRDLTRQHREALLATGFLKPVMKGWYIASAPDAPPGESTAWYTSFWDFAAAYLSDRFGEAWSLSPEQSLLLHAGNWTIPQQLLVRAPRGGNKALSLLHDTSILDVRATLPVANQKAFLQDLNVFSLPASLVHIGRGMFRHNATDVRVALATIADASDILTVLLDGGHSVVAGRLAGAFRNIGHIKIAKDILAGMQAAGYKVSETDPFQSVSNFSFSARIPSPYVARLKLMWENMREPVIARMPPPPAGCIDVAAYLRNVESIYPSDAYHSLSIEGYHVSEELIQRVQRGSWNPDGSADDEEQRNAMAARGYYDAFRLVKEGLGAVLSGGNAGDVADENHGAWYRALFGPSVAAGILGAGDLAGYRNGPVYIRNSMHVPPTPEAVRDLMPALFDLLREENHSAVRAALGHFAFVFIHPYFDGNGRMGRLLMNVMLASGGYPWTIISVDSRDEYMAALEQASVHGNIDPFAQFLAALQK